MYHMYASQQRLWEIRTENTMHSYYIYKNLVLRSAIILNTNYAKSRTTNLTFNGWSGE